MHNVVHLESDEAHYDYALEDAEVHAPQLVALDALVLVVKDLPGHALLYLHGVQGELDFLVGLRKLHQLCRFQGTSISVVRVVIKGADGV